MRAKLGLPAGLDDDVATPLVDDLLALMQASHVDHTSFFRALGRAARGDLEPARGLVLDLAAFDAWAQRWRATGPGADAMDRVNPVYVPRNHLVEEALTRRDRRRPRTARTAAGRGALAVRRAPGPGGLRGSGAGRLRRGLPDLLRDLTGRSGVPGGVGLGGGLELHQRLLDALLVPLGVAQRAQDPLVDARCSG